MEYYRIKMRCPFGCSHHVSKVVNMTQSDSSSILPPCSWFFSFEHHAEAHAKRYLIAVYCLLVLSKRNDEFWRTSPADKKVSKAIVNSLEKKQLKLSKISLADTKQTKKLKLKPWIIEYSEGTIIRSSMSCCSKNSNMHAVTRQDWWW